MWLTLLQYFTSLQQPGTKPIVSLMYVSMKKALDLRWFVTQQAD